MTRAHIDLPVDQIADFCRRWKITELALFGSVLRDDFRADSDIDVLASFAEGANWGLFEVVTMQDELEALFGRRVDLGDRRWVERSPNYIRRGQILGSLEPVYVAR